MIHLRRLAIPTVLTLALVLACGDDPTSAPAAPIPGWLNVRLSTPHPDDGGVMFSVRGGPIDSLVSADYELMEVRESASARRMMLIGSIGSGIVARIRVPDIAKHGEYVVTVDQAAARGTYQQRDVSGYSASVEAP